MVGHMHYVYVLFSESHQCRYVGSALDVEARLKQHNLGGSKYTSGRRPWKIVHAESFPTKTEPLKREKFLKTGEGREWLDNNIRL